MAARRYLPTLLLLLLFTACSGGGCPADPGEGCIPGDSTCRGDYYCSVGGVCTKVCDDTPSCAPVCEDVEDCGDSVNMDATWACTQGACLCTGINCPATLTCIANYCQGECARDGTCTFDPYEERR